MRMTEPEIQVCIECHEPTGRRDEDHLVCENCGSGPYCDECYASHAGEHFAEAQST